MLLIACKIAFVASALLIKLLPELPEIFVAEEQETLYGNIKAYCATVWHTVEIFIDVMLVVVPLPLCFFIMHELPSLTVQPLIICGILANLGLCTFLTINSINTWLDKSLIYALRS